MRIAGITIPDNKRLEYGLTTVYGIGLSRAQSILKKLGVDASSKPVDIKTDIEASIRSEVEGLIIEGDLKREKASNIKRLKDIDSHRGDRHSRGMKIRGQTTKTNNRTVPSGIHAAHKARKTMTSGKTKVEKK
ncbi:MAG: 30S ribosomal protein S13 [Candidatus Pacebacteria bacterium]|nr:30S ribosomal protein S13 [Candidatus Paceibacterota bacterium]